MKLLRTQIRVTQMSVIERTYGMCREPDNPWNWDVIFAEVSGELQKEWFPEEGDGETEVDSNGNNSKPSSAGDPGARGPSKDRPYTAFNRFPV